MCMTGKTEISADRGDFRRRFWQLLLVLALQNMIVYGVSLLDNIMIGGYSELSLSGVALVNQFQFLLQMIIGGVSDGTIVLASRHWGAGDTAGVKRCAGVAMRFAMLFAAVLFVFAFWKPEWLLGLLTDKPHVIREGAVYMRIVSPTYFFFAATQVLLGMLRSVEVAWIGFLNSMAALVTNGCLNYVLIYGKFGAPEMGAAGAAAATLVSRIVEFVIVVVYLAFFDKRLHAGVRDFVNLRREREMTARFCRVSMPVVLSGGSWGVAMAIQSAILGRMSDPVISANSIATTVFSIMSVFLYGSATAASVMIGKTMGSWAETGYPEAEKKAEMRVRARWLQLVFLALGTATGAALFVMKDIIIQAYSITPETRATAIAFMTVLSVTVVGTAYQMPCLSGIVRGGGDTRFILFNDLIFMWGLVLPASFLAAFVFHLDPVWVFVCLKSDQILKCAVAVVKVNCGNWMRTV